MNSQGKASGLLCLSGRPGIGLAAQEGPAMIGRILPAAEGNCSLGSS